MRGLASGQTLLSLPPRTDLTPLGQESNGCCRDLSHLRLRTIPGAGPRRAELSRRTAARCPDGCRCASR
jgi:hypothetical protein